MNWTESKMAAPNEDDDDIGASNSVKTENTNDESPGLTSTIANSCHLVADSLGVELLQDKAAEYLSEDVVLRLRLVIQTAEKFRRNLKRSRLGARDINDALILLTGEGQLGMTARDFVPVKGTLPGPTKDLFVAEDKDVNLNEVLQSSLPKYPAESQLELLVIFTQ